MGIWVAPAPPPERVLGPRTRREIVVSRAASALLAVSLLLAAVVGVGAAAGFRGEVVLTGSMRPAISPGDLVVVRRTAPAEVRPGQVISFRDKHGTTITHRVRAISATRDGRIAVTTQGDANNVAERWTTTPEATVGRVVATIPGLGKVTNWTGSPTGRLLVLGLIGGLIAAVAIRRIWAT